MRLRACLVEIIFVGVPERQKLTCQQEGGVGGTECRARRLMGAWEVGRCPVTVQTPQGHLLHIRGLDGILAFEHAILQQAHQPLFHAKEGFYIFQFLDRVAGEQIVYLHELRDLFGQDIVGGSGAVAVAPLRKTHRGIWSATLWQEKGCEGMRRRRPEGATKICDQEAQEQIFERGLFFHIAEGSAHGFPEKIRQFHFFHL